MKYFYFAGYYNYIASSCTNNINSPDSQNFFFPAYFLRFTHWLPTTDVYTLFLEELFVIGVYTASLLIFVWQRREKTLCLLVQIRWRFVHHTKALTSCLPTPTAPCPKVIFTYSTICNTKPLALILPSDQNEHRYPTNSAHYHLSIKKVSLKKTLNYEGYKTKVKFKAHSSIEGCRTQMKSVTRFSKTSATGDARRKQYHCMNKWCWLKKNTLGV